MFDVTVSLQWWRAPRGATNCRGVTRRDAAQRPAASIRLL